MRVIEGHAQIVFAIGHGKRLLAACPGHSFIGGNQIGAGSQCQHFQVVQAAADRLVLKVALDVVIVWDRLESDELPQRRQSLNLREFGLGYVGLKLQHLQLDL